MSTTPISLDIARLTAVMREISPVTVIYFGPDDISDRSDHIVMHELTTAAFDQASMEGAALPRLKSILL